MGILKEAENKRNQAMQKIASELPPQQAQPVTGVETPMGYTSLRNDITSVDTLQERNAAKGVSDLIRHRINLRKGISNGTVSSGNEAADYLTMRKSGLVDIFSDYMMQDKNIIKSDTDASALQKAIKTDPDSIIEYFKQKVIGEGNPEGIEAKNKAIDDYIMKGGKLNDVMDFITEKNTTPYGTPKEEKLEGTNPILNFLGSVVSTPIRELGGLTKIVEDKTGLGKYNEQLSRQTATIKGASTQGYNEYKKSGKLPDKYTEDYKYLYDGYDDAVKDGFIGSVEEYNNYLGDVAVATDKTFKQLTDDFTEKYLFNPEEAGATPGQIIGDITEIVLTELGTAGAATPELAATKLPKYAKYAKWLYQGLKGGAEFQALEDAYEGELSDVPEYAKSALTNVILKGGLESIGKLVKLGIGKLAKSFGGITERGEIALAGETPTSSAEKISVIKESKGSNPARTPEKEIIKTISKFREKVKKDVDAIKGKKRDIERAYKGEEKPSDLADRLNENFGKMKDTEVMGEQASKVVPEFRIGENEKEAILRRQSEREAAKLAKSTKTEKPSTKGMSKEEIADMERLQEIEAGEKAKAAELAERERKYQLNVDNEELLKSGYSKDKVALIDVLKEEWNKMFVKEGREFNASNLWELTKLIESKSAGTEGTRQIVGAIKDTMKQISEGLGEDYGKIAEESWSKSDILQGLDDILGGLTKRTSKAGGEIAAAEAGQKVLKRDTRELFTQAKELYGDDLNREMDSWIIHLAIYDPEKAAELAKNIYPSLPGVLELLINGGKMIATKRAAKDIVQKNAPEVPGKTSVWDAIGRSVRGATSEGLVDLGKSF